MENSKFPTQKKNRSSPGTSIGTDISHWRSEVRRPGECRADLFLASIKFLHLLWPSSPMQNGAPTSYTWGSNRFKCSITNGYITRVLTLLIGVVGPFTTGRGPSCIPSYAKLSKVRVLALCLVTRSRRRIRLQTSNQKSPKFQDLQSMMGPGENVADDPKWPQKITISNDNQKNRLPLKSQGSVPCSLEHAIQGPRILPCYHAPKRLPCSPRGCKNSRRQLHENLSRE